MTDINGVAKDIRHDLGGTGWFGATTASDVRHADEDIRALGSADANAVVSKLSDGDLASWASNADSAAPWNGLSSGEKRDLLNDFAAKLDGHQLARIARAFGYDAVTDAVVSHAGAEARAGYGVDIAGDAQSTTELHPGLGSVRSTVGNDAARAAARTLASFGDSPAAFDTAVRGLDRAGKLDDVVKTAAGRSDVTISAAGATAAPITRFDDGLLTRIVDNAAKSPDLGIRTAVFKAAAPSLAEMQQSVRSSGVADPANERAAAASARSLSALLTPSEARAAGVVATPPVAPPGVSLRQNIADAASHGPLWVTRDQVPNRHPWDYKQQGAQYANFGNFNYGLTEAAAGLPQSVALRGAGWAQQQAGTSRPEWGSPTDLNNGPYGDDPADQAQIKAGYAYYNSGQWRLWSQ